MTDIEIKGLVSNTFLQIESAFNTDRLKRIIDETPLLKHHKMNTEKYPKLDFTVSGDDIYALREK